MIINDTSGTKGKTALSIHIISPKNHNSFRKTSTPNFINKNIYKTNLVIEGFRSPGVELTGTTTHCRI